MFVTPNVVAVSICALMGCDAFSLVAADGTDTLAAGGGPDLPHSSLRTLEESMRLAGCAARTWYLDADADGFARLQASPVCAPAQPALHIESDVVLGFDCNDDDPQSTTPFYRTPSAPSPTGFTAPGPGRECMQTEGFEPFPVAGAHWIRSGDCPAQFTHVGLDWDGDGQIPDDTGDILFRTICWPLHAPVPAGVAKIDETLSDFDCDDRDATVGPLRRRDSDGDGFATIGSFCVARDAPGFVDRTAGVSTDCDDEDPLATLDLWLDADGDGFTVGLPECVPGNTPGYRNTSSGNDCDDSDAALTQLRYRDADGDGHPLVEGECVAGGVLGYFDEPPLANVGDCDDEDPAVFRSLLPDADGDSYVGEGEALCVGDTFVDGYVQASATERDPDCDDTDANVNPGVVEVTVDDGDQDCDGLDAPACDDWRGDWEPPATVSIDASCEGAPEPYLLWARSCPVICAPDTVFFQIANAGPVELVGPVIVSMVTLDDIVIEHVVDVSLGPGAVSEVLSIAPDAPTLRLESSGEVCSHPHAERAVPPASGRISCP